MTIITEQGDHINYDNVTSIPNPSGVTLTIKTTDQGSYTYTYGSALLATMAFKRLIQAIQIGQPVNLILPATNPTFTSITPSTGVYAGLPLTIVGTGFARGVRVFIGSTEVTLVEFTGSTSVTVLPPNLAAATYDVTIYNPDGSNEVAAGAVTYGALSFSSVDPNTAIAGAGGSFTFNGSGFMDSGINLMKADDGGGNVFATGGFTPITSDTSLVVNWDATTFLPAGVFTIYYSTDNGSTWTTTGLTITSS